MAAPSWQPLAAALILSAGAHVAFFEWAGDPLLPVAVTPQPTTNTPALRATLVAQSDRPEAKTPTTISDASSPAPVQPAPNPSPSQNDSKSKIGTDAQVFSATDYVPAGSVDRPAIPRSAIDLPSLVDLNPSVVPIRLRMYVDTEGRVTEVKVLKSDEADIETVARIITALKHSGFLPARRKGMDVASYTDLLFEIEPAETRVYKP